MNQTEEHDFIFTLGKIDSQVVTLGEQVKEGFQRLERKLDGEISELKKENQLLTTRVTALEDMATKVKAQVALIVMIVSGVFFFVGDFIKGFFHA